MVSLEVEFLEPFGFCFEIIMFLSLGFGLLRLELWDNWNVLCLGSVLESLQLLRLLS